MKNLITILLLLCPLLFTYTLQAQSCDLSAPVVSVCTDESTGETLIIHEDANLSAPYIIEYIITDDAIGSQTGVPNSIISISSLEDAQAIIDAAPIGETVCITAVVHDTEQLNQALTDLDDCVSSGGILVPLFILPILSWEEFYAQRTDRNGGVNPNLTLDELFAVVGTGNGPSNGGIIDIGVLAGLPPGLIVCTLPPYCYNVMPTTCMTIGDAGNLCPTVGTGDVPTVSEWGLIMLGLLTLITGLVSIRQREKAIA